MSYIPIPKGRGFTTHSDKCIRNCLWRKHAVLRPAVRELAQIGTSHADTLLQTLRNSMEDDPVYATTDHFIEYDEEFADRERDIRVHPPYNLLPETDVVTIRLFDALRAGKGYQPYLRALEGIYSCEDMINGMLSLIQSKKLDQLKTKKIFVEDTVDWGYNPPIKDLKLDDDPVRILFYRFIENKRKGDESHYEFWYINT